MQRALVRYVICSLLAGVEQHRGRNSGLECAQELLRRTRAGDDQQRWARCLAEVAKSAAPLCPAAARAACQEVCTQLQVTRLCSSAIGLPGSLSCPTVQAAAAWNSAGQCAEFYYACSVHHSRYGTLLCQIALYTRLQLAGSRPACVGAAAKGLWSQGVTVRRCSQRAWSQGRPNTLL